MKALVLRTLHCSGLVALERRRTRAAFRIVTYHGVDERDHPVINADRLQTPPALFARHVESLARQYRAMELGQAVRFFLEHGRWPERGLAITFDDGYRNNLEQAAPILKRLGLPATFFVTASFIEGRSRPWWYVLRQALADRSESVVRAAADALKLEEEWRPLSESERAERLAALIGDETPANLYYPFMNRDEVAQLAGLGFDVQPHGDEHLSFRGETADRLKTEIESSAKFVREVTGRAPWGFAYPYGHLPALREPVEAILQQCGLQAALSTIEGNNDAGADRWALRRWDLHGGYSVPAVSVRVAGLRRRFAREDAA